MATIDPTRYVVVPRTTGPRLLSAARLLCRYAPSNPNPAVSHWLAALSETVTTVGHAYADRFREYGPSLAAEEAELDLLVDNLYGVVRGRVDNWQVFARPGAQRLAEQQQPNGFDFAGAGGRARTALRISSVLFPSGLEFTKLGYQEQHEHMLTLDETIDREELEADLDDLVDPRFMAALAECRDRYAEMIEQRGIRALGSAVNLREQNDNLKAVIQSYVMSLFSMHRADDPKSVDAIKAALRPIDALREQLARERGGGSADPIVEDERIVDELLAEETALNDELGLPPPAPPEPAPVDA